MAGELAVLERDRLLCLIEHRCELEVRRQLAVDGAYRVGELALLGRIRRERPREPADHGSGRGHDDGNDIWHGAIVPRRRCMHRQRAIDTSDV